MAATHSASSPWIDFVQSVGRRVVNLKVLRAVHIQTRSLTTPSFIIGLMSVPPPLAAIRSARMPARSLAISMKLARACGGAAVARPKPS